MSAMDTGLILLPASLAMALVMPIVGKLYNSIGPRWLMFAGIVLLSVGTVTLSWLSLDVSHAYILFWMVVRNLGIALVMMPSSNAGMELLPRELSGHASAIMNWNRNVFGSFAIAIFTTMLATRSAHHGAAFVQAGETDQAFISAMSFTMSVNDVYLVATFIAAAALPLSLFVGKVKPLKDGQPEKKAA